MNGLYSLPVVGLNSVIIRALLKETPYYFIYNEQSHLIHSLFSKIKSDKFSHCYHMKINILLSTITLFLSLSLSAQHTDANIFGDVQSQGEHIPFANVYIEGTKIGTTTDATGHYMLIDMPVGEYTIIADAMGFMPQKKKIDLKSGVSVEINFELKQHTMALEEIVITGTKTAKRKTETSVIVNVIDAKTIESVQACNISEGLKFQPGLRVETDCQTCNYSQLRMNGLGGGYSQILINGRPVFSPLLGLYGMEQIPASMVERIEVVRGGGSALYGSSAIGGTVNIITKIPTNNTYDFATTYNNINGGANDFVVDGNISMVTRKRNAGAVIFINKREREAYDHPGITLLPDGSHIKEKDGYSELPQLKNNSFGANLFYRPTPNQKIEVNFSSLYEYRYGGQITERKPHFAMQSEERTHNIFMGGADYHYNSKDDNTSYILYLAGQYTDRDHYTGLYPVREEYTTEEEFMRVESAHLALPPYGFTHNTTLQAGTQLNHRFFNFFGGTNVVSVGADYSYDDILDSIPTYQYTTDQTTHNVGVYAQSDWKINDAFIFLAGIRADKHSLVERVIASPRLSAMYTLKKNTQFRLTWGTGFRAPQAFDADMHIAFAGGGISRILLANDLKEERSNSLSGSLNYDLPKENYILGLTLEGFYTRLQDAFYLQPSGSDELGELYEKKNGPGATVQGVTLELRANYDKKIQLESGLTLQKSLHDEAVENIEGLEAKREFLRTPESYGYLVLTFTPNQQINASVSGIYTGSLIQAKFSPDERIIGNQYRTSDPTFEINLKAGYTFEFNSIDSGLELYCGVKNLMNTYQDDFDNWRNRDSNYIYGPSLPRTFYIGIRVKGL